MREKIRAGGHESPCRLRKQPPEPVFGQIKQARGFRQFLLRGVDKAAAESGLVCLAHTILKLAQRPIRLPRPGDAISLADREPRRKIVRNLPPLAPNPIAPALSRQAPRAP